MDYNEFHHLIKLLYPAASYHDAKELHHILDTSKDGKVDF
jgi:hypothetical protein